MVQPVPTSVTAFTATEKALQTKSDTLYERNFVMSVASITFAYLFSWPSEKVSVVGHVIDRRLVLEYDDTYGKKADQSPS